MLFGEELNSVTGKLYYDAFGDESNSVTGNFYYDIKRTMETW